MSKLLDKYQIYLYSIKLKIPALYWIAFFVMASIVLGGLVFLINSKLGFLVATIILDLGIGIPYYMYNKNLGEIERYWPEALRLIADTMKSGSSFDYALREVSSADFGPLSNEFNEIVRRLEMGDNMSQALDHMALRIESKIVRRTITLIQECLKTGAQLSEVLEDIASDTKQMFRIKKERETKTMLQTIFIFAAGAVIAPFIFGLTNVITQFLTTVATTSGIASAEALEISKATQVIMVLLLDLYVLLEVAAAAVIISLMREGKFTNAIIFFPIMIIIAYLIYWGAQVLISGMLTMAA
ncbi:MAG: type II secretion system F family protein [archaeon]